MSIQVQVQVLMNIFQNFNKLFDNLFESGQSQINLFLHSCLTSDIQIIKILLEFVDPTIYNNRAISQACLKGHFTVVELLLADSRMDLSTNCNQAFRIACEMGYVEIVDLLLRSQQVDQIALEIATQHNKFDVINLFLQETTLHSEQLLILFKMACFRNYINIIDRLLQESQLTEQFVCNPQILNEILCWSIKNIDILHLILNVPQFINIIDKEYLFKNMCKDGNEQKMFYFLYKYPQFDPIDYLIQACLIGMVRIVDKLLLDETGRVDPTVCEHYAFRISCENGYTDNVRRFLQDKRTDPSALNNYAIRQARKFGYYEIVELIRQDKRYKH